MTRPNNHAFSSIARRAALVSGALVISFALGCGKKEAEVTLAPEPPPAPSAPRWSLSDVDMDARVQFPDRVKPRTQEVAQAVADFASALVKGDTAALASMLSPDGQVVLEALQSSGEWASVAKSLKAVRICRLDESDATPVLGLGLEDGFGATMLAWRLEGAEGSYTFTPMPIEAPSAIRVAMLDDAPLVPPSFGGGGVVEAPIVLNAPTEDDKKKGSGNNNRPSPSRTPDRRPAPSGPTPVAPPS